MSEIMNSKVNLYPHQQKVLDATKDFTRVAYYLDMGIGKTYIGSEKAMQLQNRIILVVCQKSKIQDWFDHYVDNYSSQEYSILNLCNKKELDYFITMSRPDATLKLVGIINYDLIWRRKDLMNISEKMTLILDESSLIQNRRAKRTKFILKMKADAVILLSGTPVSGKWENLVSQANLLGWNITEKEFLSRYCYTWKMQVGNYSIDVVDKKKSYKNKDEVKTKLKEHGAIFMKTEEVMTLPDQTFIKVKIPINKEYKKFTKDKIVNINGEDIVGDTILKERLYSRQIISIHNIDRVNYLKDIIESTNDRLIVFYSFDAELKGIIGMLDKIKRPYAQINGHVKNVEKWRSEDDCVLLAQYQAASKGLNLQECNKIIYYSPTEKVEDWMQSQKRIHRLGQNRACFYYVMYAPNTIEQDILEALERGEDYTNELFLKTKED